MIVLFYPVPPDKRPEIEGVPASYSPGDFLSLNCTTTNVGRTSSSQYLKHGLQSSVPPHITWVLNKEEVTDFGLERHYPSTYSTYLGTTLTITTLGLQFWVKKKHFKDGKLVVSCSATIPHIYNRKSDSYVVGRLVKTVRQL